MSDFLSAAGQRLECRWVGPPADAAPTLVLLHEGLGCVALWRDFPERLVERTGCGAFVFSRAGYGRSDPVALPRPLSYMHDEALQRLGPLLDAAGVRRAVLVGHSDGASIAAIYAGTVDDPRIVSLVLMAPHFFNEDICIASARRAKTAYETTDLRARLARYHGDNVDCAFLGWNGAWLDPGFLEWNIERYIAGIRVPVLAIQGEDDEYGSRRQIDVIAERGTCPLETRLLPRCRHAPFNDQPQETLAAIAAFVARTAPIAPAASAAGAAPSGDATAAGSVTA